MQADDDIAALVSFARLVRPDERALDYPSVFDLPRLLALEPNRTTTRRFFDAGGLAAFAYVDAFHTLRFDIDFNRATPALEAEVVAWGRECLRRAADAPPGLLSTAHQDDAARIALLERNGFVAEPDAIVHLRRSLAAPVASVAPAPGFVIRPVQGEAEAAVVAALHRAAFGTPHMTAERRLATMRAPGYRPELDLVAVSGSGTLAAYAMGSVSDDENRLTGRNDAYADQFATHPDSRARGLAHALMAEVLARLRAAGYDAAWLSTSSDNRAMLNLAYDAGFEDAGRTLRFGLVA